MDLRKCLLTKNDCYKEGRTIKPQGIVVHSTGANNKTLKRYVQPDDGIIGKNLYGNDWNRAGINKCVNAFIGCTAKGTVSIYQTLPWNMRPWGCGSGSKGSYNNSHIQFEICEDNLKDETYFNAAFEAAIELCAFLCKEYKIPVVNVVSHSEASKKGYASNHADCDHWLSKFGKNMDWFRSQVSAKMIASETKAEAKEEPKEEAKTNDAIVWDFLKAKGLNNYAIAGIIGNIRCESNFIPRNLQNFYEGKLGMTDDSYTEAVDNGSYTNFVRDSAGYGLCQWTYWSRKENLLAFAKKQGKSIGDLEMQLEFMWYEMSNSVALMNALKAAKTVREASDLIALNYEKPAKKDAASVQATRAAYGQQYFDKYAKASSRLPYKVKVTTDALNIRNGAGVLYTKTGCITDKGVYTIVEEKNGWGKLKSGAGWISLSYTKKL